MIKKELLVEVGFSDKEAKVYLALLEMGRGTASQIARSAGIQRTTAYNILDILVSKKLVQLSGKEPKEEYIAESPDKILTLLKEQSSALQEKIKKASKLSLQLKSIQKVGDRAQVKFYEGKEGLKEVYEDTLTSTEEIRAYATLDDMYQALPGYFPDYFKRRAKKKIAIKAIIPATPEVAERMKYNQAEKFRFSPEINIYDNKVMIASWREKLGIIIESAEIADAMKKIYELAWLGAESLEKKI
ncbi:MAG: hypothetical protein NTV62_04130 [Candidatus Gribaldobacteria bacterium]|nr:hypothetical protein [Candidatus Gribaldobacteria bacterium]